MKTKTFEELATDLVKNNSTRKGFIELMKLIRDATAKECSAMANEHGAFYTCDEIDFKIVDSDYIILSENNKNEEK